ncbi:hypothetical protein BFD48_07860 [Escherichia coli]|nr:hypothetical protein BFD48_07860 [Escherichia coli]
MGAGYKKGRRLLPLRPVSGAYCHHGSLTPVFTLLPVTPPADNRCGNNSRARTARNQRHTLQGNAVFPAEAAGCYPCGRFRAHIAITAA